MKSTHQSCVPSATLESRLKQCEDSHQVALQKEREELNRVKLELEQIKKEKADAESALKEKSQNLTEAEDRAKLAESRLEELRVKPAQWLAELQSINLEMSGKFFA